MQPQPIHLILFYGCTITKVETEVSLAMLSLNTPVPKRWVYIYNEICVTALFWSDLLEWECYNTTAFQGIKWTTDLETISISGWI